MEADMQAVCHMQAVFDMQGGDRPCERTGREDASKMQASMLLCMLD